MTSHNFSDFELYIIQNVLGWDSHSTVATAESPRMDATFIDPQWQVAGQDIGAYDYAVAEDATYVDSIFIFHSTRAELGIRQPFPYPGSILRVTITGWRFPIQSQDPSCWTICTGRQLPVAWYEAACESIENVTDIVVNRFQDIWSFNRRPCLG
jgi:hypothetical protein